MGFEQLVRRLALTRGRGWPGAIWAALVCVFGCTLVRAALTPLLGSLGGATVFVPAVIIAGLWTGRRGAYIALVLGVGAAWMVAWLHPDPINVRQFLIGVRLAEARDRLVATNATVEAIAGAIGFGNVSHFTRTFTQAMGMCPTAYRRQASLPPAI